MQYYTGIGSRETPQHTQALMKAIASKLEKRGYTLRSGGASGADLAFEAGTDVKQIFIPWKGFNDSNSQLFNTPKEAFLLASQIHPAWHRCSAGAQKLHARNTMQVLGPDLETPSEFVVCWTENGETKGGTATAINLAIDNNIPVFNLGLETGMQDLADFVKRND